MVKVNEQSSFAMQNKNLLIFSAFIFLLGLSSLVFLQKLSPLISHTTYYCQSFINSLPMPIPYYLAITPFLLFFAFLLIATIRLLTIYIKVQLSRKKLLRNCKSNTRFTMLLEKLQLTEKTYLIESEKQFAFCLGVRRSKVYISTALLNILNEGEIEAVLRHERYHLHNRDTLIMLIASIGQSLLPFFPLISDFLYNYRIEREIRADAEAIQGLGDEKPLISVLKKLLTAPAYGTVTASAIADHDTLEPRIQALIKKDLHLKKFKVKHIFISLLSIFVMSIIMLAPVQAVEVHHMGEDVMMICPNNNECLNACRQKYSTNKPSLRSDELNKNYSENVLYTPLQ